MALIQDGPLELTKTWDKHVGTDIGGVAPDEYGWRDHPLDPLVREFYTKSHKPKPGEPYADWLAACHRPVKPNTGKLSLMFDLYVDDNAATVAQACEFDTKLAISGQMANFSSQFNYNNGFFQISGPTPWKNTTWRFGKFAAGKLYKMRWDYGFDIKAKLYSFIRVRAGDDEYDVPTEFQNFPMKPTNWRDSCNFQLQQDLNKNGGGYSEYIRNAFYLWS